jgi:hypothetical protein
MFSKGYGNEDYVYTQILKLVDSDWFVRTNDQYFSLTDQLNLGVHQDKYYSLSLKVGRCVS